MAWEITDNSTGQMLTVEDNGSNTPPSPAQQKAIFAANPVPAVPETPLADMLTGMAETMSVANASQLATAQSMQGDAPEGERALYQADAPLWSNIAGQVEGLVQMGGTEVGRVAGLAGEVIGTAASQLTPDVAKAKLKEWGTALAETEVGLMALEALRYGGDKWSQFKKEYPTEAKTLGSTAEIASVASPATRLNIANKLIDPAKAHKNLAAAKTQRLRDRTDSIYEMLRPALKDEKGDIDIGGFWGSRVIEDDPVARKIAEEVQRVDKVNPKSSYTFNAARVQDAFRIKREQLDAAIKKRGNPLVNPEILEEQLSKAVAEMSQTIKLSGSPQAVAEEVIAQARKIIATSDGTALGLLNARRELDALLRQEKPNLFDGSATSQQAGATAVRNAINEAVALTVPKVKVRKSLGEQYRLRVAHKTLHEKGIDDAKTHIGRMWQNITDTTGVHLPTTPLAIAATGAVAASAIAPLSGVAAAAATGGTLWWLQRSVRNSPAVKKIMAQSLIAANKAIAKAEGAILVQLKADRLLLIDLMNDTGEEEQ